jgi:nucleoside-diphosphate-sugar epimerase
MPHIASPIIVVAGAGGDLGARITRALIARGATVRAIVRPDSPPHADARISALGATLAPADPTDVADVAAQCRGAACVVSALNGRGDVILGRQGVLLEAAARERVPRFISSDFALDYTCAHPGDNGNLDLRRAFMARADAVPIRVTSIFNGGFMDLLDAEVPIIQHRIRRVLFWGSADHPLDLTSKDDVAAFTAAAALDPSTPRILRIAGDTVSVRDIARMLTDLTGEPYRPLGATGPRLLEVMVRAAKLVAPRGEAVQPPWQGMQYIRDMFGTRNRAASLDNDRYPEIRWTPVRRQLASGSLRTRSASHWPRAEAVR